MADDSSFEALFQDSGNGPREERILVIAPPGKLGMVLDTPPGEGPLVHAINESSVLKGRVKVGDRLITVDKEDVSTLSAAKVSVLITQKSQQERTFEFIRGKKR
jgi:C-terminal processing protease CtpA/Prc